MSFTVAQETARSNLVVRMRRVLLSIDARLLFLISLMIMRTTFLPRKQRRRRVVARESKGRGLGAGVAFEYINH